MKTLQFLLVLLGGLFPCVLNAGVTEGIYFSHIGLKEGLSHSTVLLLIRIKKEIYGLLRMMV